MTNAAGYSSLVCLSGYRSYGLSGSQQTVGLVGVTWPFGLCPPHQQDDSITVPPSSATACLDQFYPPGGKALSGPPYPLGEYV